MKKLWQSVFLSSRFFLGGFAIVLMFSLAYFWTGILGIAKIGVILYIALVAFDAFLLFRLKKGISANRKLPDKFSNGDINIVKFEINNHYPFSIDIKIIDEIPFQFQKRDFKLLKKLDSMDKLESYYELRPVERGIYQFGNFIVYVKTRLGFIERCYHFDVSAEVAVFPAFHQLRNIELLSFSKLQHKLGLKKIRKTGNTKEFEQVRSYVVGDELKRMNWKATARKNQLMVNQYLDEREQNIYCVIDMGRNMKMPFNEMSLLDYAINSTLALSKVALINKDKVGLVTYSNKIHSIIKAGNKSDHLRTIMETLYRQKTDFRESTLEQFYALAKVKITHRSLLILFTNFESIVSMQRQMNVLKQLSRNHIIILVSFENTELTKVIQKTSENLESIYLKTIAEKFSIEKRIFMQELNKIGVYSVLSSPQGINTETINKYLEIKARGLL